MRPTTFDGLRYSKKFQFQNGTIMSVISEASKFFAIQFQFQNGTIMSSFGNHWQISLR